jgi:mercuric reductase
MTCSNCARHIEDALKAVPGVEHAVVDYRAGCARVMATEATKHRDLLEAVAGAGYRAELADHGGTLDKPVKGISMQAPSPNGGGGGYDFDLLVIGTGGAGVAAAIQGAGLEAKVAIAEGAVLGGTCVNIGCIPSKNLIEAAGRVVVAQQGFPGIDSCRPAVDWSAVMRGKDAVVGEVRRVKYADVLASYHGVVRLEGWARLLGDGRVTVGSTTYRARKILLATGAVPALPPIPGLDTVDPLTSTSAMDLTTLPTSMIVIGGGPVGVELGQMFARVGVKVVIVQRRELLPGEEPVISACLGTSLEAEGIEVHTGMTATKLEREGPGVVVHVTQASMAGQLRAERVLVAAGRRPNTEGLGLEVIGVALTDRGFVQVDPALRTTNPDIFAAGDVTNGPAYVYVAAAGGRLAARNALRGETEPLDLSVVPRVTFTDPQVAAVGLTELEAKAAGYSVETSTLDLAHLPRAIVSYRTQGLVHMVAESGTEKLLGIHAVGANAGELMGEATLAIRFGLTARDLSGTMHPYLTWTEAMKLTAQGFATDISKLSCCA